MDQQDDHVYFWYVKDDYFGYAHWFQYQDDLNVSIRKSEKLVTVYANEGTPNFHKDSVGAFVLNPSEERKAHLINGHRIGAPTQTESGEISLEMEGAELVSIWNEPISRINEIDYCSILIFDENGVEINRCGRSETPWKQIAVGHFLDEEDPMEVEAVPAAPIEGRYPVFVFKRGYMIPSDTLYQNNTSSDILIAVNEQHELQVAL